MKLATTQHCPQPRLRCARRRRPSGTAPAFAAGVQKGVSLNAKVHVTRASPKPKDDIHNVLLRYVNGVSNIWTEGQRQAKSVRRAKLLVSFPGASLHFLFRWHRVPCLPCHRPASWIPSLSDQGRRCQPNGPFHKRPFKWTPCQFTARFCSSPYSMPFFPPSHPNQLAMPRTAGNIFLRFDKQICPGCRLQSTSLENLSVTPCWAESHPERVITFRFSKALRGRQPALFALRVMGQISNTSGPPHPSPPRSGVRSMSARHTSVS